MTKDKVEAGPVTRRAGNGPSIARFLWGLSAALLAGGVPVVMIVSNRSSASVLVASAVAAALASGLDVRVRRVRWEIRMRWTDPMVLLFLSFIIWANVSLVWSLHPGQSAGELYGALITVLAAIALSVLLVPRTPRWTTMLLVAALIVAMVAMWIELNGHFPLMRLLHKRIDAADFNRPALTLLILFWPLVALLRASRQPKMVIVGMAGLTAITFGVSHSGTSVAVFAVSILAYVAAALTPRLSIGIAAAFTVASFVLAPWIGKLAERVLPDGHYEIFLPLPEHGFHARERIEIWKSFGAVARREPLVGAGFGASRWVTEQPVAKTVPADLRRGLAVPHPHEMYLQVWIELGAVGVVLLESLVLSILWRLAKLPRAAIPARFAAVVAALCMAEFSHGAWQAWWTAALGASWVLFEIASREAAEAAPSGGKPRSRAAPRSPGVAAQRSR